MTVKAFESRDGPGTLHVEPHAKDIVCLCLTGEFDMANAPSIGAEGERALAAGHHLIFDLSQATFMDSYAVAALVGVATRATTSRRLAVLQLGTAAIVETALRLGEVEAVLPRANTRFEAVRVIRHLETESEQQPA